MSKMKTAIFLGAGASAAEDAPMQNALFKNFFESFVNPGGSTSPRLDEIRRDLTEFFASAFHIHLNNRPLSSVTFPTFEEALGILDLAESRGESLRIFGQQHGGPNDDLLNSLRVKRLRQHLVLSMAKAIADGLQDGWSGRKHHFPHRALVRNLIAENLLNDTIFISTNYDLLIDEAITLAFEPAAIDYGVEFAGPPYYLERLRDYNGARLRLLKVHGSLNWLRCATCNNLQAFDYKVVITLIDSPDAVACGHCGVVMSPVIVPPTFYKDMSKVFLSVIWNKAENALREVDHVIFCGYSFPDADMHIKYLLKRAQTNRDDPKSLRFTVINTPRDEPKGDDEKKWEKGRYERFLGKVGYKDQSFNDFAKDPRSFYDANDATDWHTP